MLDYMVQEVKPDVIFWTGDNASHDISVDTPLQVLEYTKRVTQMLKDAIKDKNITVLPAIGNHDMWVETE